MSEIHSGSSSSSSGSVTGGVLVKWIQTFSDIISKKCNHLDDLTDGFLLYELMQHLAPEQTKTKIISNPGDLNAKINNIKILIESIETFLEENFGTKIDLSQSLNVNSIVKQNDADEIIKLLEYIILCAIHSAQKDMVINNIMQMDEGDQQHMMELISDVSERFTKTTHASQLSAQSSNQRHSYQNDDEESKDIPSNSSLSYSSHNNLNAPSSDSLPTSPSYGPLRTSSKDDGNISELKHEVNRLSDQIDELTRENRDLKKRASEYKTDLEKELKQSAAKVETAAANATTAVEEKYRSDAQKLQRLVKEYEHNNGELKREVVKLTKELTAANRKASDEIEEAKKQTQILQDELDLAREKTKRLAVAEKQLEHYKKKLETVGDFKTQLQDSEAQINSGLERIVNLEQENKQIPTLKAQISKLKDSVVDLQAKMQDLTIQEETSKQTLSEVKEKLEGSQKEAKQAKDQLEAARDELRKFEAEASFTPMKSLSEQTGTSDRVRVLQLEAENRELKNKLGGADMDVDLDMAKKLLETTRNQYKEAKIQINNLKEQVTFLTQTQSRSSTTTSSTTTPSTTPSTTSSSTTSAPSVSSHPPPNSIEDYQTQIEAYRIRNKKLEQLIRASQLKLRTSDTQRIAYGDALKTLKQQVQERDMEIKEREKMRQDEKQATKLEQRLMASAFYEFGMEFQQILTSRARNKTQSTPAKKKQEKS